MWRYWKKLLAGDPRVAQLDSIPGIGTWSAIALTLEIGDVSRFATVRSLIAYAGLDPRTSTSGDGVIKHGISHRGNANIRATLFMVALVAKVHNPVIAAFYQRLTTGEKPKPGKVALTACMAKILRIAYALLCSGRAFDAAYEEQRAARAAATRQAGRSAETTATQVPQPESAPAGEPQLDAPITRKEARRRRERAAQKADAPRSGSCEVRPQAGTGASAPVVSRPQSAAKRPLPRS